MNKSYDFTIKLYGVYDINTIENIENVLYESGCDHATISIHDNIISLMFSTRSSSLQCAIDSAIQSIIDSKLSVSDMIIV